MGLASYREDLMTAFLEGQATPFPYFPAPPHQCPFCDRNFDRKKELSDHLASAHRGERPVLLIDGLEPARDAAIRQAIRETDIVVENCTFVRVSRAGVVLPEDSPETLSTLIVNENNTVLEIDLFNKFDLAAEPINQFYRLSLRVPDKSALDAVDRDFVRILASETVNISDVDRFLRQRSTQGAVQEYADALASYVRGVLVKDGRGGSTLPFSEAEELYGRALETLHSFRRPLAYVVSSLVRLTSNDFTLAEEGTGFDRLDHCHFVLAPTIGRGDLSRSPKYEGKGESGAESSVALCPLDQGLDTVLQLADRFKDQHVSLTEYRQALGLPRLTGRDRAKICVLHALAALKSSAVFEARETLSQLRNEYPFEAWASRELDRLDGLGNGTADG